MDYQPSPHRPLHRNPKVTSDAFDSVSAKLAGHLAEKHLAGAVLLVGKGDDIVHFEAQGTADLETGEPIATDAIFRIHSMTKAVTSVAALILVDRQLLALEDPVSRHLPSFDDLKVHTETGQKDPPREMTIRDLMRHTSGLTYPFIAHGPVERAYRRVDVLDKSSDLAIMVDKLSHLPLKFPPGENWGYSIATDVLGHVIEVVSGQSLDAFFAHEILDPLGMSDTAFFVPEKKLHRLPASYTANQHGHLVENDPGKDRSHYADPPTFLSGGGGLLSTATDYFQFLQMLRNDGESQGLRILSEDSVLLLTTDQLPHGIQPLAFDLQPRTGFGFSLGLTVCTDPSDWDPSAQIGEFGWGGAASTHYWVSPFDDLTVIILQQTMPFSYKLEHSLKRLIYEAASKI